MSTENTINKKKTPRKKIKELLIEGASCLRKKKYHEVVSVLDEAIQLGCANSRAYFDLGYAFLELGEYEKAIANFDRAENLNPGFISVYFNRGLAYFKLRENEKAISDFDKSIKAEPNEWAYFYRGLAHGGNRNYRQSDVDFTKAISLKEGYFLEAIFLRGRLRYTMGKNDETIKERGIQDLRLAATLGFKEAQYFLDSEAILWKY